MASRFQQMQVHPGDILLVVHDFKARSPDELGLRRGDKIELIERDDDFGDGWFLGRHLARDDSGLFPEVYTTPAPKPTSVANHARRFAAQQATPGLEKGMSDSLNDDNAKAPSVQPPGSDTSPIPGAQLSQRSSAHTAAGAERSFSAPLTHTLAPSTPPSNLNSSRPGPTSAAQRSISLSNGIHQNSPVMNETLSVIEEHITDMSTPRHSLLMPEDSVIHEEDDEFGSGLVRRLSYINGHETDEEESGMLSEAEVQQWSPDRVAEYLEDIGVDQQQCKVFKEQEISGEVLLGMDQGSLMLKEFELGSIGKRLALWQKIRAVQEEVRVSGLKFSNSGSLQDSTRSRSTSVGTVLPRIPSLMDSSSSRTPSRQQTQRSPSHQKYNESISSMPAISDAPRHEHTSPPSAASVRSLNHSRRHSSIDQTNVSLTKQAADPSSNVSKHTKQGSFDQSWTMGGNELSTVEVPKIEASNLSPDPASSQIDSTPSELGMTVVSSLDLDRGYFSGNEVDNRKARNVLRKKGGDSPNHGRAPSDSYGNKRLSAIFRHKRAGSTDSIDETGVGPGPTVTQLFYGTAASPTRNQNLKHPSAPPTVTKLEYGDSPSIDAVAASPNVAGSETSSIERPAPSPAANRNAFTRARATGLRAISDAITNDEKALATSPTLEKGSAPVKESPLQSPSQTGSSTPSVNSKSIDMEDSSLLKSSTGGSTRQTPLVPRRKGKKNTSAYTRGLERKTPKEQLIGCDYSGWMKKKSSNLMTTWKTRLFVLRGRRLSYYYSEDDAEEKGLIDISFHRVLPANNDRITGLHATVTGASSSPTSPQNAQIQTTASQDAQKAGPLKGDNTGMFIFKLVPPRAGLSKGVNFTKPTVHYFAVDNVQQGRLWMAALMKATIDRDEGNQVITTYKEKTISLTKAKAMRQRPPALMGEDDADDKSEKKDHGLAISYTNGVTDTATTTTNGDKERSLTTGTTEDSNEVFAENVDKSISAAA